MPHFAANLSMLFTEKPIEERFEAAAQQGFSAVEIHFPYDAPKEKYRNWLQKAELELVLMNVPAGNWATGERGLAALPGREDDFAAALEDAITTAKFLDCTRLHAMAGVPEHSLDRKHCEEVYIRNLTKAAQICGQEGLTLLIEPINGRDIPGYFLQHQDHALQLLDHVASPHLMLQYDLYHCQVMDGDLSTHLMAQMPWIGHIQIAGVPDRHEPAEGEVNYPYLFRLIDHLGYQGWIGCEYHPRVETVAGLGWARPWGIGGWDEALED